MKISTRGRYALRMMIDIALHGEENPVRIKDIAARQQISEKYLEQIVSVLNKGGFVRSSRGPMGGYRLAKRAEEYTAFDILTAIEGSLAPVACLETEINDCPRKEHCDEAIRGVLKGVTLANLVERQKKIGEVDIGATGVCSL